MAQDALLVLQASTTKTASFSGSGLDLTIGAGPHRTLWANIFVTALAGSPTATAGFVIEASSDNTNFFTLSGPGQPVTATGAVNIAVTTHLRYVRLTLGTVGVTTPSVVYNAYLALGPETPHG